MATPADIPTNKDVEVQPGPSSSQTDVIVKMQQPYMDQILAGTKTYEFRKYLLPSSIQRIWFFLIAPDSRIDYVCEIEPAVIRKKGVAKLPEDGIGNQEFNEGREDWEDFAYRVGKVWKLGESVALKELVEEYGLDERLKGWNYTPKGLVERVRLEEVGAR